MCNTHELRHVCKYTQCPLTMQATCWLHCWWTSYTIHAPTTLLMIIARAASNAAAPAMVWQRVQAHSESIPETPSMKTTHLQLTCSLLTASVYMTTHAEVHMHAMTLSRTIWPQQAGLECIVGVHIDTWQSILVKLYELFSLQEQAKWQASKTPLTAL